MRSTSVVIDAEARRAVAIDVEPQRDGIRSSDQYAVSVRSPEARRIRARAL